MVFIVQDMRKKRVFVVKFLILPFLMIIIKLKIGKICAYFFSYDEGLVEKL